MGEITEKKRRDYSGLDADKASILAGGKDVNDTFLATDTKILYYWDGAAWIIIPLDVITTGMIKDLNITKGKAELGFGRYVPQAVAGAHFTIANFGVKDAWQANGLDLSGIVPAGAIAVHLIALCQATAAIKTFGIRANATTKAWNKAELMTQVANIQTSYQHNLIYVDADRLLDYFCQTGISSADVAVLGWLI